MMLDAHADLGRRVWLPCSYCYDNGPLYVLDFDVNLVWVQCGNCLGSLVARHRCRATGGIQNIGSTSPDPSE